jgi:hypothetical protein
VSSRKLPALIALAGVIVAVGLFFVLKDDTADEDAETTATTEAPAAESTPEEQQQPAQEKPDKPEKPELPVVEIKNGEPVGGVQELEFPSGEQARFEVVTDAADELHFHGYDLYVDVAPGKPTEVEFDAGIEGLFELESHSTGTLLAEISVVP